MKKNSLLILLFGLLVHPFAQLVIEEDIETDTVSLFSVEQQHISPSVIMAASIVVPGVGHRILQRPVASFLYTTTDVLALFGAVLCYGQSRRLTSNAQAYAWAYAGASAPSDDDAYWRNIGYYMDAQQYNTVQELNRTPQNSYLDTDTWWRWPGEEFMDEYNKLRTSSRKFQVASSFLLGALVLNRVVSFVDARTSIRRANRTALSTVQFTPVYSFDYYDYGYGLAVTKRF